MKKQATILALFFVAFPISALKTDRGQELFISSDESVVSETRAKLMGNVRVEQGSLKIEAAKADIKYHSGQIEHLMFTGSPVKMQQKIENQGLLKAVANSIEYFVEEEKIILQGAVRIERTRGEITSERVVYNVATGLIDAGQSGHRVKMVIKPLPKEPK